MTEQTNAATNVFEQAVENMRKTAQANLEMQQEIFRQWTSHWPAFPKPQTAWMEQFQRFQKEWSNIMTDLVRRHREVLDRQYQASLESLEQALRVAESKDPEEYRKRVEQLCRKTLDGLKEISDAQLREFQNSVSKWTELLAQSGP